MGRNVQIGRGELDILALDGQQRVVVEVRSITGDHDPIDAIDTEKRRRVSRLAAQVGADRVDFVGVRIGADGVDVHWVPGCG